MELSGICSLKFTARLLTGIAVLLSLAACRDPRIQAAPKQISVFDALLYKGKPDLTALGMSPIRVIYEDELWNQKEKHDQPNTNRIIQVAKTLKPGSVVCIDIECWPSKGSPPVVAASIEKYVKVARTVKAAAPLANIGFYGVLPDRDHWRANGKEGQTGFRQWQGENDALKPIGDVVDYIFPSLYTLDTDPQFWRVFAEANIAEAKRYGKPVYVFLWPQYHSAVGKLSGQYIPKDFWGLELDVCFRNADGIVIWGGWQEQWEEKAPWWVETKTFLKGIR